MYVSLQLPSTYNFALFTLLLEDDFQSGTVNFARLQLPSTYNFSNKWGAGMIGADVARSTPVRNCFGPGVRTKQAGG